MKSVRPLRSLLPSLLVSLLLAGCAGESPESLLASARDYLARNDSKAAVIQIKNALQKNPDIPEARFLLGKALLAGGDASGAELELRKALALKHPADETIPLLARALMLQGQHKKLVDEFGAMTVATPEGNAELQSAIAVAHAASGNEAGAEKALSAALQAKPDHAPALLVRARQAGSRGDLPGALATVDAVLARDPANAEALKLRGDLLLATRETDAAIDAYRKAVQAKPDFVLAHAAIVSTLLGQGKVEEAGKQVEQLRQVSPKHPMTLLLDGRLAFVKKDFSLARQFSQQVLAIAPDNPAALQLAGSVEFQLQSYAQAEVHFARLVRMFPGNVDAHRLLALTHLRLGQPARAKQALEPVLGQIGDNSNMLALAGEVAMQNGEIAQAEAYYAKASALDPGNVQKKTAVALMHVAKGSESAFSELEQIASADAGTQADMALIAASIQRQQFDKALKAIDALEKKQPNNPQSHHLRGAALVGKKDGAGARRSFERALALAPAYFPSAAALASLDLADKQPEQARKRFEAVLAADPKSVQALLALAELKVRSGGSPDEVAALLEQAVAANPTAPGPRMALIDFHWRNKDVKKTLSSAQDAIAAQPERSEFLDALGRAQLASGDANQALATFNKFAAAQPNSPLPQLRIAEAQVAAKDTSAATQSLNKALAIKPDFIDAQRGLVGLHAASGAMEQAVGIARSVQRQRPKEAIGYLLEGDARSTAKAWGDAAAAYRNGLKNASDVELATRLHTVLLADEKKADAERFAATWIKDHPKDAAFRMYLGGIALASRNVDAAAGHYRAVVDLQPNNAVALNNLAWVSFQQKSPKALEYAEKANRLAPGNPAFMDTLAIIVLQKGDAARAVELLRKALAGAPQSLDIRVNYALALIKSGDKAAARKEIDALTQLGDKGPRKEILDRLNAEL